MSTPSETGDALPTGNSALGDAWVNCKRWTRKTVRNPTVVVLEVVMAALTLVVFDAVFGQAGGLALAQTGFDGVDYVTFLAPAVTLQVTMASSFSSGMGLVSDLETGMFEKAVVSPMGWTAVFAGKAAADLVRVVVQVLVVLGVGLAMGGTVETGVLGVVGIVAICLLFAVWYMALSNALALLVRDEEALDAASLLLMFPLLFLSSGFLPPAALSGWTSTVARLNPVTYAVDAVRALALGRDVASVTTVTTFGGPLDTVVPAVAILVALDLVVGALAVALLARASSADAA